MPNKDRAEVKQCMIQAVDTYPEQRRMAREYLSVAADEAQQIGMSHIDFELFLGVVIHEKVAALMTLEVQTKLINILTARVAPPQWRERRVEDVRKALIQACGIWQRWVSFVALRDPSHDDQSPLKYTVYDRMAARDMLLDLYHPMGDKPYT